MRATVLDYGASNLHSLGRALTLLGHDVRVETDARRCVSDSDVLVLPGVGAFGPAAQHLVAARAELRAALLAGHPCIGICLGMQLFFTASDEGEGLGLDIMRGHVERLTTQRRPHIGWSTIDDGSPAMYFAHGYICRPTDDKVVRAWAQHEDVRFPAIVQTARTIGVQFHPEKSSRAGVALLGQLIAEVTT